MQMTVLTFALLGVQAGLAWPGRTYVVVPPPPPGYAYVQPSAYTYVHYVRPGYVIYPPAAIMQAQPAAVQMPLAAPSEDTAAALARLDASIRALTTEQNMRALQSRVLELERRQMTAPPPPMK